MQVEVNALTLLQRVGVPDAQPNDGWLCGKFQRKTFIASQFHNSHRRVFHISCAQQTRGTRDVSSV